MNGHKSKQIKRIVREDFNLPWEEFDSVKPRVLSLRCRKKINRVVKRNYRDSKHI